jgi:glycerol-3-phosphate acyltransferase PlsY
MSAGLALAFLASYLIGAIPTSYWVVKLARGVDLRTVGSGNLGATNLYRFLGWKYAIPVGIFDLLKGTIPVVVIAPIVGVSIIGAIALGLAAVLGHVYSPFVGFKGGKGVATGGGVILGIAPWAFLVSLAAWVVVVKVSGYVSLGSIIAAVLLAPSILLLHRDVPLGAVGIVAALSAMVIWFHRANLRRLRDGTENRFGRKAAT